MNNGHVIEETITWSMMERGVVEALFAWRAAAAVNPITMASMAAPSTPMITQMYVGMVCP